MAKSKRIKDQGAKKSRLLIQEPASYDDTPPIFSLERIQSGDYCFSKLGKEGKAQFAEAIFRRKSLTWKDIKQLDRHGLGTEKIPK